MTMVKTKQSVLSRPVRQPASKRASTKFSKHGTLEELPPLGRRELRQIEALKRRPDSEIDFSDIPETTEAMWREAIRGNPYLPKKKQLTVRLDAEVLEWLKGMGKGYQTKLN